MKNNSSIFITGCTEAILVAKLYERGGMLTSELFRYIQKEKRPSSHQIFLGKIWRMKSLQFTRVCNSSILFVSVNKTEEYIPISEMQINKLMLVAEWELKHNCSAKWFDPKMKLVRYCEMLGAEPPKNDMEIFGKEHNWFPADSSIREYLFPTKETNGDERRALLFHWLEKYPQNFPMLNKRMAKIEAEEECKQNPKEGIKMLKNKEDLTND